MYYQNQNKLFSRIEIDQFLQSKSCNLEEKINRLSFQDVKIMDDQKYISDLLKTLTVAVPVLKEEQIKIDAKEGEVENYRQDFFHDEPRTYRTKGLIISVELSFNGDSAFFDCRATTYTLSGTPTAEIRNNLLILHYETSEKDPEKIKGLWWHDIVEIKKNLEWLNRDVVNYNNSLENNIKAILAKRKKELEDTQSLINKITS